ncbi:phage tail tape measure protein [Ethanoligenens sp.]|uniref:phage tail tape measure protein n=1 Tax=Ethanoligenens sp. TaxID=2099655 RepID=UPI0039EA3FB0
MGNNIKGITVDIGGNVGPLASALQEVNTPINKLQSELKEVNRQLKFDPSNTTLLKQKQDLLAQSADALKDKQAILKKAVTDAQAQFEKGNFGADKVRAVEREYEKVTSQLKDVQKQQLDVGASVGTLGDKIKSSFSNMGQSIKSAFSLENVKAGIGSVGAAVGAFLGSSISKAQDAQKANADLAQTLKSTGGASGMTMQLLDELTESMIKNTTFSDDEVKSGEGMLLTFTNIGKNVFPQATAALLDMSQKMGTAPKDAAVQLGKALNDPVKGITALTRVGVTFTDQQKDQIAQMVKTGDMAGAQKVILGELNKEFGGQAAAAADTYAGKQKQLQNTMEEVQETIGTALMPMLAKLLQSAMPIIQTVADFVSKHPQLTAAILAIVAVIGLLVGGLSLLTTVTTAFGMVELATLGPITLVVAAIAGLAVAAVAIVTHWKDISGFFVGLWKDVSGAFNAAKTAIGNVLNGIAGFFRQWGVVILAVIAPFVGIPLLIMQHWGQISAFFVSLWNGIKAGISAAWNGIKAVVMAVVTPLINGVMNIWNGMKGGIQTVMNGLKNILGGIWTVIKNIVLGPVLLICDLVTGNFGKLHDDAVKIFTNIQNGLAQIWAGIQQVITGVVQVIVTVVMAIWNSWVAAAQTIFNALAAFFTGLWNGIKNVAVDVWNGLIAFFTGLPNTIGNIMNAIGSWVRSVWDGLVGFVASIPGRFMSGLSSLGGAVRSGFQDAISFITGLPDEALKWGGDIINGIVNGIKNAAGAVGKAVQGVAQDIRSFLHFSEPDTGPLVGFHGWWKDMMYGMAEDINSNIAPVADAARHVAESVASNIGGSMSLISTPVSALSATQRTSYSTTNATTNNTKAPVININGPINMTDAGSKRANEQQLQFMSLSI